MFTPVVELLDDRSYPDSTIIWKGQTCLTLAGAKRVASRAAREYAADGERLGNDVPATAAVYGVTRFQAGTFNRIALRRNTTWKWTIFGFVTYGRRSNV